MNGISLYIVFGWIMGLFFLNGCASLPQTVSDVINQKPLSTAQSNQSGGAITSYLYGGKGIDSGMDIRCAQDGSCLLFGETIYSFGSSTDYLAVKTSPDHKIVWAKSYDGSGSDRALSMAATSDGGYLLVGLSKSLLLTPLKKFTEKPGYYPLIIRIDPNGNVLWARVIEYRNNAADFYVYMAIQTSDKGFVITGFSSGQDKIDENMLFKLSENGDFLWGNIYRSSDVKKIRQLRVTESSDWNLSVFFEAEDTLGLFVTDPHGKPIWAKTYKGEETKLIRSESYTGDHKEGFVIAATNIFNTKGNWEMDLAILRLTRQGKILWSQQYDIGRHIVPRAILEGYDNDLIITGAMGEGALGFVYGGSPEFPLNSFALQLDEDGKRRSNFISAERPGDSVRSAAKNHEKYLLLGDMHIADKEQNCLLSVWQPQKEVKQEPSRNLFSQRPFKVKERDVTVESKSVELESQEIKGALKVQELKVNNDGKL